MKAYVTGIGNIAPQDIFENEAFLEEPRTYDSACLHAIEPNYKDHIKPIQLRRMSRILRMGVTSAMKALQDSAIEFPDAIITATGIGMMEETEKFLNGLIDQGEKLLNPTAFIQSTHNTVGAQIAVMLGCNHYNFTYVHGPISFESALLDGLMWLDDKPSLEILLGGVEEMTPEHFNVTGSVGFWKQEPIRSLELLDHDSPGTIAGEGAAFFVLTGERNGREKAVIRDVKTIYRPESQQEVYNRINSFLEKNGLEPSGIDVVITGMNGDNRYDSAYRGLETVLPGIPLAYYKHLCGEHYLASSFSLWLAVKILQTGKIPPVILRSYANAGIRRGNILLYNQYQGIHHSLMLVSSC